MSLLTFSDHQPASQQLVALGNLANFVFLHKWSSALTQLTHRHWAFSLLSRGQCQFSNNSECL